MEAPTQAKTPDWILSWRSLRLWIKIFLILWLGGGIVFLFIMTRSANSNQLVSIIKTVALIAFFASIVPYIFCLVFAYKVQDSLHNEGYIKHGSWQVLVAGIILNPYFLGFYIPLSVNSAARKAFKKLETMDKST
jgi:hypothetical protein